MTADTQPMGERSRPAIDDAAEIPGIVLLVALMVILGAVVILAG